MVVLELILVVSLLVVLATRQPVLRWFATLRAGDARLIVAVVLVICAGQFLSTRGQWFPLTKWGMYAHVYEPEEIRWAELHVTTADGRDEKLNPVRLFPSLARNFEERLLMLVDADHRGELSAMQQSVFDDVLRGYLSRYNARHPHSPAVAIRAVRRVLRTEDRRKAEPQVVRTVKLANDAIAARAAGGDAR